MIIITISTSIYIRSIILRLTNNNATNKDNDDADNDDPQSLPDELNHLVLQHIYALHYGFNIL